MYQSDNTVIRKKNEISRAVGNKRINKMQKHHGDLKDFLLLPTY